MNFINNQATISKQDMVKPHSRLHNLDYLRGLAAFGIMIYHYLSWIKGNYSSADPLGRIGVYGVSIFYVLSGLTLYHVYNNTKFDVIGFFKKRIFRIYPLLWLVTIFTILLSQTMPPAYLLMLNFTGLFGFIRWWEYIGTGVWSIGNELVFYIVFPVIIYCCRRSDIMLAILGTIILSVYIYFAFFLLNSNTSLVPQWKNYINPLNQVFLFFAGALIGKIFKEKVFHNRFSVLLILAGLILMFAYPVSGDPIHLVTGYNRLVFTVACCMICLGFYKLAIKIPALVHKPLSLLGEASYSVYLIHPIVFSVVSTLILKTTLRIAPFHLSLLKLLISVPLTLAFSYLVYRYFEKYFIRLGRRSTVNV